MFRFFRGLLHQQRPARWEEEEEPKSKNARNGNMGVVS
jgi:hypothetical protein